MSAIHTPDSSSTIHNSRIFLPPRPTRILRAFLAEFQRHLIPVPLAIRQGADLWAYFHGCLKWQGRIGLVVILLIPSPFRACRLVLGKGGNINDLCSYYRDGHARTLHQHVKERTSAHWGGVRRPSPSFVCQSAACLASLKVVVTFHSMWHGASTFGTFIVGCIALRCPLPR